MPGARRARSLACKIKKHTSIVTTVTPVSPGIPYAMVLNGSFVLSPVNRLVATVASRNSSAKLDASMRASGPHDFAVRGRRLVRSTARPPHLTPVRDDRDTPLMWDETARVMK